MSQTIAEALRWGVGVLRPEIGDAATRDARVLLAHALDIEAGRLTLVMPDLISAPTLQDFEKFVALRQNRKPVSQIVGRRQFWGRWFQVSQDVLDPRPETESMIAAVLEHGPPRHILDLGTGSGCILLTVLAECPKTKGVGTDLSAAALNVAGDNALDLGVEQRAVFVESDWFAAVEGRFDVIVSNPPYISEKEMGQLQPEVADWEPQLALTPGGDGLGAYRKIAGQIGDFLERDGLGLFEIGKSQGPDVCSIFQNVGFSDVSILRDLNGHDRIVRIKG